MKHRTRTRPFRGPGGEVVPGSIAEAGYLRLGGADQWVMIRGESAANPLLVLLHGGPGYSETHFFRHFNAPLERSFTVVYWDQRGAGKSFDRAIPRSSLTVERLVADLAELVEAACGRVGQRQAVLFGHSWGSALGALYAARFPDRVSVYVGCEQVGDSAAAEAASYAFALAEAERQGSRRALRKLRAIGPPPYDASSVCAERTWLSRLDGSLDARAMWGFGRILVHGPEWSLLDLPNLVRGFRSTMDAMYAEVSTLDLTRAVPELRMPVFFFQGRRDHWIPPETSLAYFRALRAPCKRLVWFDESGHEPFVDEPEKFNAAMVELVRPAAAGAADREQPAATVPGGA